MHVVKLVSAHCENFKGFKSFDIQFGNKITHIKGANGLGKSSVIELIMWVLHGVSNNLSSNPKVRREVDGVPVSDVHVVGEITMEVDGKKVVARKVQKRSIKKDKSYSDENTYSINGLERNLKDFIAYFDFSFDDLLLGMNIDKFLAKKPKEMREFLFKLPEDISVKDIILQYPEFAELVPLLENYKDVDEIRAINKRSIKKLDEEMENCLTRIDEVSRQVIENIDTAELELQKEDLQRQIAEIEKQEDNSLAQATEYEAMSKDILDLQFKKSEIERQTYSNLAKQKKEIQKRIDEAEIQFRQAMNDSSMAEMDKKRIEDNISRKKAEKAQLLKDYTLLSEETFCNYIPLPELSEDALTCPTCGQELPGAVKAQKRAEYDENSRKQRQQYENDKTEWERRQEDRKTAINIKGQALKMEIEKLEKEELPTIEERLKSANERKVTANGAKNKALEELNAIPDKADLSDNQEYESLCQEIAKKEEALKSVNTGADYRATLRNRKAKIQAELDSVKDKIKDAYKSAEAEDRVASIREALSIKEQAKSDYQKINDLLDQLEQKKNELMVVSIDSHFNKVKWQLWADVKNGNYKPDCIPLIDNKDLKDNSNKALVLEAKIDIATSIQRITGITAPVILDDGEALDTENLHKILAGCECQVIVTSVSDNKELQIEVS